MTTASVMKELRFLTIFLEELHFYFSMTTSVGHLSIADSVFCALYHLETLNSIFFITFFYGQPQKMQQYPERDARDLLCYLVQVWRLHYEYAVSSSPHCYFYSIYK